MAVVTPSSGVNVTGFWSGSVTTTDRSNDDRICASSCCVDRGDVDAERLEAREQLGVVVHAGRDGIEVDPALHGVVGGDETAVTRRAEAGQRPVGCR